jgi:Ca2+-binding EF-hand superfamily protein
LAGSGKISVVYIFMSTFYGCVSDIEIWAQKEKAHLKELYRLVQTHDKDKSGNLNAAELRSLLEHYAAGQKDDATAGAHPTDAEIAWILQAAGKHKINAVDVSEIEFALDLWHSYVNNRTKIEEVFDKYDTNHSQRLEIDQLKLYLTDLNGGQPPKVIIHGFDFQIQTSPDCFPCLNFSLPCVSRTPRSVRSCRRSTASTASAACSSLWQHPSGPCPRRPLCCASKLSYSTLQIRIPWHPPLDYSWNHRTARRQKFMRNRPLPSPPVHPGPSSIPVRPTSAPIPTRTARPHTRLVDPSCTSPLAHTPPLAHAHVNLRPLPPSLHMETRLIYDPAHGGGEQVHARGGDEQQVLQRRLSRRRSCCGRSRQCIGVAAAMVPPLRCRERNRRRPRLQHATQPRCRVARQARLRASMSRAFSARRPARRLPDAGRRPPD